MFDGGRYFDVFIEYAKAGPDDVLIQVTVANRGDRTAPLHLLPTLWFRNTWSWGRQGEGYGARPQLAALAPDAIAARHADLGAFVLRAQRPERWLFTENETNRQRLYGLANESPFVKDAFHDFVVQGREGPGEPRRRPAPRRRRCTGGCARRAARR